MTTVTATRWKYIGIQSHQGTLTVMDMLMRKPRAFSVPQVMEATVVGACAYATTGSQKLMKIDLESGTRQFLSANDPEFSVAFRALVEAAVAPAVDHEAVMQTRPVAASPRRVASVRAIRSAVSAQAGFDFLPA